MTWDSHSLTYNKHSSNHQQTPVSQNERVEEIDRDLFNERNDEEHSQEHQRNLSTFWFGVNSKDSTARITGVYGEIVLSSRFPEKSKQFPSLVSFVGTTGAGKSTLIVRLTCNIICDLKYLKY
jgi:flagellar biosynthesis GTPase FlhF